MNEQGMSGALPPEGSALGTENLVNMSRLRSNEQVAELERGQGMSSYTPGPWRVGNHGSVICDAPIGPMDDESLAFYGGNVVCGTVSPANAPLIVKAPELAEALRELLELAEPFGQHSKKHEQSKQAFARAAALLAEIEA